MPRTRVLVVEDSLTVRKRLVEVLSADPELEVIGEAGDGKTCIELCQSLRPDVITLDMMLPIMTGLSATEYIMAYCPTPILIVSASTNRGDLFRTYEALSAGAVDVLEKPRGDTVDAVWDKHLIRTVKLVARIKVITHPRARLNVTPQNALSAPNTLAAVRPGPASIRCIAVGASTGGPAAVREILRILPKDFPIPILLVIHIGAAFATSLADWLDTESPLRVRHAIQGEVLPPVGHGVVLMAPAGQHMGVHRGRLRLTHDPERHSCRPSVDVLFETVAADIGAPSAAFLLTGMGRDGAEGLLAIRRAGGRTFAQDEASSAVYGMPREAAEIGAANAILPLDQLAYALLSLAPGSGAQRPPLAR